MVEDVALAEDEPAGGHAIVADDVGEPCELEQVTVGFFLAGYHVPTVDVVAVGEGLDAAYHGSADFLGW